MSTSYARKETDDGVLPQLRPIEAVSAVKPRQARNGMRLTGVCPEKLACNMIEGRPPAVHLLPEASRPLQGNLAGQLGAVRPHLSFPCSGETKPRLCRPTLPRRGSS